MVFEEFSPIVPNYDFGKLDSLSEDPRVFKLYNNSTFSKIMDDIPRFWGSIKERIIAGGKMLENEGWDKHNICGQLRFEQKERHATEDQLRYITEVCPKEWKDHRYDSIGWVDPTLESRTIVDLENKITDKKLNELVNSRNESAIFEIAEHKLSNEQVLKMPLSEREQYRNARARLYSEYKGHLDNGHENFQLQMIQLGLLSKDDKNKKSTLKPPKELWGYSDTYEYLTELSQQHDVISKYLLDVARQVFVFRLQKKLDKEALGYCKSYHDKRLVPLMQVALIAGNEVTNILENIQDEKNRDTTLGWMIKGMHKHWDYGNHGTGEVDYIQTGEYIFRLGKENNVVIKVPIKRETTREQIGDKTTVKILDKDNQLFIKCPECKLEFNKPIIGDEERDMFAGDLFYKACEILQANELSKAMETICDNVMIQETQTPEDFYKKEMKRLGKTINVTNKDQIKVIEAKPEKIKEVKIPEGSKSTISYNIMWGRAHRTQLKSEHFSNEA